MFPLEEEVNHETLAALRVLFVSPVRSSRQSPLQPAGTRGSLLLVGFSASLKPQQQEDRQPVLENGKGSYGTTEAHQSLEYLGIWILRRPRLLLSYGAPS